MRKIFLFLFFLFNLNLKSEEESPLAEYALEVMQKLEQSFAQIMVRVQEENHGVHYSLKDLIDRQEITGEDVVKIITHGAAFLRQGPRKNQLVELKIGEVYGYPYLDEQTSSSVDLKNIATYLNYLNLFNNFIPHIPVPSATYRVMREYYFSPLNLSLDTKAQFSSNYSAFLTSLNLNSTVVGDWGFYFQNNTLGLASNLAINVAQNQLWAGSGSGSVYASLGAGISNNSFSLRSSVSFLLSNIISFGAGLSLGYARDRHYTYLGQAPLDDPFPEVRGLYKVQLEDMRGLNAALFGAFNLASVNVPIVAYGSGADSSENRIVYRTYVGLKTAQEVAKKKHLKAIFSDLKPKLKSIALPILGRPETFRVGDEIVFTQELNLSGAFFLSAQFFTNYLGFALGGSQTVRGHYEIGMKKFPLNRLEVVVTTKTLNDSALIASIVNFFVESKAKELSLVRKQSFLFNLNNPHALKAYQLFIEQGILPEGLMHTFDFTKYEAASLLEKVRTENDLLSKQGIQRTLLEEVKIDAEKVHVGVNLSIVDGLLSFFTPSKIHQNWGSFANDFSKSTAASISVNPRMAVKKTVVEEIWQHGRLYSGVKKIATTATLNEMVNYTLGAHSKTIANIVLQSTISDTSTTFLEEFRMVNFLNRLFSTRFKMPQEIAHHHPREIILERTLNLSDIQFLISDEAKKNFKKAILRANHGILSHHLSVFSNAVTEALIDVPLAEVEKVVAKVGASNRHLPLTTGAAKAFIKHLKKDQVLSKMVPTLIKFVSIYGARGFSFIHHMLGANLSEIMSRSSRDYEKVQKNGRDFLVLYATPLGPYASKKDVKKFTKNARKILKAIDKSVENLAIDPFVFDKDHLRKKKVPEEVIKKIEKNLMQTSHKVTLSNLLSIRKEIAKYLDLKSLGFNFNQRIQFYQKSKKHLGDKEKFELLLFQTGLNPQKTSDWNKLKNFSIEVDKKINLIQNRLPMKHYSKYVKHQLRDLIFIQDKMQSLLAL